jgi:hypothetical protein
MANYELVEVNYVWHNDPEKIFTGLIYVGNYDYALENSEIDNSVFFYVNDEQELDDLYSIVNGQEFYLVRGE